MTADIERRTGVRVIFEDTQFPVSLSGGSILGMDPRIEDAEGAIAILEEQCSVYPAQFFESAGIHRIILCSDLNRSGRRSAALADLGNGDIYLDVAWLRADPEHTRRTIHHEIFHLLDHADDGWLYADPSWSVLNADGWTYGAGGRSMSGDPSAGIFGEDRPGFLNKYSTSGVEEDKATVFACLVVNAGFVDRVAAKDEVIAAKVERMKEIVVAFSPEMDERFWAAARTTNP